MEPAVRKIWRVSAWGFAVVGVAGGIVFLRLPWVERFDFDILGFAWVFLNAPKLGAFVVMVLGFLFAAILSLRSRLSR
jgi:hypothetical protein